MASSAALHEATARLAAVSDTPRLDAEVLMAHALGIDRGELLTRDHPAPEGFGALVDRRLAREPVAYITGTRGFWSIDLDLTRDVLIPRPDSETLIEAVVARFGEAGPRRVLDLGTGSGALLLAALAEWPGATGVGVDASPAALAVAQGNATRIAPGRAILRVSDWGQGIDEQFDLVLCNPPYVKTTAVLVADVVEYEPHAALFAGIDGLADYRRLMPQFAGLLTPGGIVALEIGHSLAASVTALAHAQEFAVGLRRDLGGRDRCLVLTHPA